MPTIPSKCVLCAHFVKYYPIGMNGTRSVVPSYKCAINAYSNSNTCKHFELTNKDNFYGN